MTPIVLSSPPRKILIIKPSAIGDVVHTLPVLDLLRRRWPASHIGWLVTPACAGLLERHPPLDEVVRFERLMVPAWLEIQEPGQPLIHFDVKRAVRVNANPQAFNSTWLYSPVDPIDPRASGAGAPSPASPTSP